MTEFGDIIWVNIGSGSDLLADQPITWTSVHLSPNAFYDIHHESNFTTLGHGIYRKICSEITISKVLRGVPGATIWRRQPVNNWKQLWRHQMKTFPRYWPFVRDIHRSSVNCPHKGQVTRSFDVLFDLRLNKQLSKLWWGWWFETPTHPLWRRWIAHGFVLSTVASGTLLLQHQTTSVHSAE